LQNSPSLETDELSGEVIFQFSSPCNTKSESKESHSTDNAPPQKQDPSSPSGNQSPQSETDKIKCSADTQTSPHNTNLPQSDVFFPPPPDTPGSHESLSPNRDLKSHSTDGEKENIGNSFSSPEQDDPSAIPEYSFGADNNFSDMWKDQPTFQVGTSPSLMKRNTKGRRKKIHDHPITPRGNIKKTTNTSSSLGSPDLQNFVPKFNVTLKSRSSSKKGAGHTVTSRRGQFNTKNNKRNIASSRGQRSSDEILNNLNPKVQSDEQSKDSGPEDEIMMDISMESHSTSKVCRGRQNVESSYTDLEPPSLKTENQEDIVRRERREMVAKIREEGRKCYMQEKYKESIAHYTEAIKKLTMCFTEMPNPRRNIEDSEILAFLYGNRAAVLMMLGAFDAALKNCKDALKYLNDFNPLSLHDETEAVLLSHLKADGGLTLKTRFLERLSRIYLKLGQMELANKTLDSVVHVGKVGLNCHQKLIQIASQRRIKVSYELQEASKNRLQQCITDATLNKRELKRFDDSMKEIKTLMSRINKKSYGKLSTQVLHSITSALSLASGNIELQEKKVQVLASMKRWVEVLSFCENQACLNVSFDGIFTDDLKDLNPFIGVPKAIYLNEQTLKDRKDSNESQLNAREVEEAVLRLPHALLPFYLRALRLDERNIEARIAGNSLSRFYKENGSHDITKRKDGKSEYYWLSCERSKLQRTLKGKEEGDTHYLKMEYTKAAEKYAAVLKIDSEEASNINESCHPCDKENSGGRLHAILHGNRAACFMALKNFYEAAKECTAALRIENKYLKAMVRLARCYVRLENYDDALKWYGHWTGIVEDTRSKKAGFYDKNACHFDHPSFISESDYLKVLKEISDVQKSKMREKEKADAAARAKSEQAKFQKSYAQSGTDQKNERNDGAYHRRQQWYDQKGSAGSRRWDSFRGASPKRDRGGYSPNRRPFNGKRSDRYHSSYRNKEAKSQSTESPGSSNVICHYKVLQLNKDATEQEVKKSYHKMALKYHPDKNKSESAADTFRKVKLAHEVLSDPMKRRKYDAESRYRAIY